MLKIELFWQDEAAEKNGRKRAPRLNIFQKVQIADYAAGLLAESRQKLVVKKRRKTHAKPSARKYFAKGLNLQALCENKFPQMRGIKICQLIYQCETQSWRSLSVHQQKRYYQLPDSLKVALGIGKVKGWKSLDQDALAEEMQKTGKLNRWSVPGPVLEERYGSNAATPISSVDRQICFQIGAPTFEFIYVIYIYNIYLYHARVFDGFCLPVKLM